MDNKKVGTKTGKTTKAGRDVYKTSDGEMVSEKSTTFKYKDKWINVPTIHNGYQYDDETLMLMLEEGLIKPTSIHDSLEEAEKAAIQRSENLKFNKGGMTMMNRPKPIYNRGGLNDEGGEIDEVSGNRVPVGGTKEGVRDDIDVNMSAGEWVADEATTRYHGIKTFLGMRDEALMGMKKMEAMGLMGNSDEATLPADMPFGMADLLVVEVDDSGSEKEIDMAAGGLVFNRGGTASTDQTGETISLQGARQQTPVRPRQEVTFDDVMAEAKMEFKEYRNSEGQSLMVPFIGGVPLYPIPEGYTLYTGEGSETGETDLPDTGAEAITPSAQEDRDDSSLIAYRASAKQNKGVEWETLSDEAFLEEANKRNGFGRNLAMGVASLISPLASIGMAGLLRMEDNKVLEMARSRLAALPQGSAQRAEYEKMIESYEARGKGIMGTIIGKIVDVVGGLFGSTKEQKAKAQNANLVGNSSLVVGKYSSNGQPTQAGVDAVNSGLVEGVNLAQYNKAVADLESTDPEVKKAAQETLAKFSAITTSEATKFVNKQIMDVVNAGIGDRTPEETRAALVNLVYQPSAVLKNELDGLTQGQKDFLGYDGTNYRDIVDYGREQLSAIAPRGDDLIQVTPQSITRDFTAGATTVAGQQLTTPTTQTQEQARQDQVNALIDIGISPRVANATVPMVDVPQVQVTETRNRDSLEGPEAAFAATPTVTTTAASEDANIPVTTSAQSYATMDMGEAGRTAAVPQEAEPDVGPSFPTTSFGQTDLNAQTEQAFQPTTVTTTGVGSGRDAADMPITADQVAYSTSGAGQSGADQYDPRTITQVPSEQVTNIPVTVSAQMDTPTLTQPAASDTSVPEASVSSIVGDPYVVRRSTGPTPLGAAEDTVPSIDTGTTYTDTSSLAGVAEASTSYSPDYATMDMGEAGRGATTEPAVTLPTSYDTDVVQQQMAELEDNYMAEAFGTETPATTEKTTAGGITLAEAVPETSAATTSTKSAFEIAFDAARAEEARQGIASGTSQFEFNGQMFSTATAEEVAARTTQTETEERQGRYDPTANKALSAGFTTNTLSQAEQDAFDAAVDRGDSAVADHFANINRLRNKQDAYAASNFDPAVGASLGLSAYDMEQAEKYGGSVQTAINQGRAESGGFLQPAVVTDDSKSKTSTTSNNNDRGSTTTTTTSSSDRDNNVASSGRTESQIQADINAALDASGGEWTSELNDLVSERDSARANEGTSGGGGSSNNDSGGGGGASSSSDDSCCFIMLEARYGDGTMDEVVRRYRDEHMTDRNRRGYYKVAEVLVPLMRKSPTIKWLVTKTFADPLVSYGKYYYGQNKHGVIYSPIKNLWMKLFDTVGGDTEFIRENGETV